MTDNKAGFSEQMQEFSKGDREGQDGESGSTVISWPRHHLIVFCWLVMGFWGLVCMTLGFWIAK